MVDPSQAVTIVDYGMGNLHSLSAAIKHLGFFPRVTANRDQIARSRIILLPGVGSFAAAMDAVRERQIDLGLKEALGRHNARILGICLGMQLLTEFSVEDGGAEGLGLIAGRVEPFSESVAKAMPVPHIGFNLVQSTDESRLFQGLPRESDFYFVHSFRLENAGPGLEVSWAEYGERFVAAFESPQVYGAQFHPEKSQSNGLKMLENFLKLVIP
jgi:glutamine amidotransferase